LDVNAERKIKDELQRLRDVILEMAKVLFGASLNGIWHYLISFARKNFPSSRITNAVNQLCGDSPSIANAIAMLDDSTTTTKVIKSKLRKNGKVVPVKCTRRSIINNQIYRIFLGIP